MGIQDQVTTNKPADPDTSETALAGDKILFSSVESKNSILDSLFGQNGIYRMLRAKALP